MSNNFAIFFFFVFDRIAIVRGGPLALPCCIKVVHWDKKKKTVAAYTGGFSNIQRLTCSVKYGKILKDTGKYG